LERTGAKDISATSEAASDEPRYQNLPKAG
jgi:hypothetical protein